VVVSSAVIDILLRVAEKNSGKILGIAADKVMKLRDAISVNFSDYYESSVERCSHVTTIFDRSKPVNLFSIYVQTKLSYSQHQMTDKQLREQIAKVSAGDSIRIFLITGSAGTGKTFLMRWLFLSLLETASSRIPLYVELRGINHQTETDLLKFLFECLVTSRARVTLETFRSGLNDGEYIFILDGLDEVQPERRSVLSRQIMELQTTHRGIILVVSSRPDEGLASWVLSRKYTVLPLDKKGATALIRKLPYLESVKRKFSQEVDLVLYDRHTSFLSNPLLINVMLLTYGDSIDIPRKMHLFYEQAYETLFYRHDSYKETGFQRRHACPLLIDEFKRVLSAFCASSYKRSRYTFTTSDALELIRNAAEFERIELNAEDFLRDGVESVCILQIDGLNYTFTHRSFQEFFAAVFISRGPAIALGNLLDALASRRGDIVLRMVMDMNHSLIEREWILPRLGEILSDSTISRAEALAFATRIFGDLMFEGSRDPPRIEMKLDPFTRTAQILFSLTDLFPDDIKVDLNILDFTEEDGQKIEALLLGNFNDWWERNESLRRRMVDDLREYRRIEAAETEAESKLARVMNTRNVQIFDIDDGRQKINKELELEGRSAGRQNVRNKNKIRDLESQLEMLESERQRIIEKWKPQEEAARVDLASIANSIRAFEKDRGTSHQNIRKALHETKYFATMSDRRVPSTNEFRTLYFQEFWRLANANEIDLLDNLTYESAIELCVQKLRKGMKMGSKLEPRSDAEWFSITAAAERVASLAQSLTKLHKNISSSIDKTKKIGTKLLD
jgi:hypothetical protein